MTWPMVYLIARPSASNLMLHACGGVRNDLPVGALPRNPSPQSVPEAWLVNQRRPGSNGSARKW